MARLEYDHIIRLIPNSQIAKNCAVKGLVSEGFTLDLRTDASPKPPRSVISA